MVLSARFNRTNALVGLLNNDSGLAFAVNLLFLRCLNRSHAN